MDVKGGISVALAVTTLMTTGVCRELRSWPSDHEPSPYSISSRLLGETLTNRQARECIIELLGGELLFTGTGRADEGSTYTESALGDTEEWQKMKNTLLPMTLASQYATIPSVEASFVDWPDGVHVYVVLDSDQSDFAVMRQLATIELSTLNLLGQPVDFRYVPSKYVDPAKIVPSTATRCYTRI